LFNKLKAPNSTPPKSSSSIPTPPNSPEYLYDTYVLKLQETLVDLGIDMSLVNVVGQIGEAARALIANMTNTDTKKVGEAILDEVNEEHETM